MRTPTLADVAQAAGVSRATASRVANGGAMAHRIAPATVERVEAAIRRLGYSANPQAQALRTGRPQAIGILGWNGVLSTWWHPWHIRLLHGVELTLELAGYDPVLLGVHRPGCPVHQPAIDALARRQVAGVITLVDLTAHQVAEIEAASHGAFISLLGSRVTSSVARCDLGPGLDAACAHLASLGHRALTWVDHRRDDGRMLLARAAAARHGLRWSAIDLGPDPGIDAGAEATQASLRAAWAGRDAPAVLAGSDLVALAVLDAWRGRGLRVPEDRSLIGIDDLQAPLAQPALTSVSQMWEEVGTAAVRHVLAILDGSRPKPPSPIPSRLIIRNSTAAPRTTP